MNMWDDIWRTKTSSWFFTQLPESSGAPAPSPITANQAYIQVYLKSMRIPFSRKGLNKFFGAVHSYLSIPHISSVSSLEVNRIVVPQQLKDVDSNNVDKIISFNHLLLGPIPYRGGDLGLQVGLFSVKSGDLSAPFLNVLEGLSSALGVSYFTAALQFVKPLKDGISVLTNSSDNAQLEIGISGNFSNPASGIYIAVAAEKSALRNVSIQYNQNNFAIDFSNGEDYPYIVIEIKASDIHETWFQIPDLNDNYAALQKAVKEGNYVAATELLATFERTAKICPDLLFTDGKRLAKVVKDQTNEIMGTTQVANLSNKQLPNIDTISLFR
jgi:hypothetical protein